MSSGPFICNFRKVIKIRKQRRAFHDFTVVRGNCQNFNENIKPLHTFQKSDVNYCTVLIYFTVFLSYIIPPSSPLLITEEEYEKQAAEIWPTDLRTLCVWACKMIYNNIITVIIVEFYSHFFMEKLVLRNTGHRKPTPFWFWLRLKGLCLITEFLRTALILFGFGFYF